MKRYLFLFVIAVPLFSSCEDNMFLRSEKKMKSELQGVWQREFLGDTSIHYNEYWIFNGDYLYTAIEQTSGGSTGDVCAPDANDVDNSDTSVITHFKIDARIFRAYLKLQPSFACDTDFVDNWEFVELEDDVLYIAADNPLGPGVFQREFFKIK
jgi:hypothetical protein